MARNGSGTYNLPLSPAVSGTTATAAFVNTTFTDLANALTQSLSKDGQTTPTANLPMGGFRLTGLGDATARTDAAPVGQVQNDAYNWAGTAGGTADALTLTPSPAITAYAAGQRFRFIAAANNTGAATVAVSGLTATAIQQNGSALSAGQIATGKIYEVLYDGTQFQISKVGALSGDVTGPGTVTDGAYVQFDGTSGNLLKATTATVAEAGAQTISIPAQACVSRTTNGAASATTELATNDVMLAVYDFDAATSEAVQIMIPMPKSWNEGTVTAQFLWTAASSSGDVVWGCRAAALSNDDAIDGSWGTGQTVTDTLTAVNDLCITAATSAITIGGTPAEGDLVVFEFYRDAASGSDTLAADARLISVRLIYTTDAANDA